MCVRERAISGNSYSEANQLCVCVCVCVRGLVSCLNVSGSIWSRSGDTRTGWYVCGVEWCVCVWQSLADKCGGRVGCVWCLCVLTGAISGISTRKRTGCICAWEDWARVRDRQWVELEPQRRNPHRLWEYWMRERACVCTSGSNLGEFYLKGNQLNACMGGLGPCERA